MNEVYRGRGNGGILGCDHFNEANDIIREEHGENEIIEWRYTQKQLDFLNSDSIIKDNFDDYE